MVKQEQYEKAIKIIQENESLKTWVSEARERSKVLKALVNGKDYSDVLINEIEKLESKDRAKARKKYSKDVRDMFNRVFKNRYNVFEAVGGSEFIKSSSDNLKTGLEILLNSFKGNKSIEHYLSEYAFNLWDVEPNGLIFMEYITTPEKKIYPTFKSINDIRLYQSNGQILDFVLFEPKTIIESGKMYKLWRYVDSNVDISIKQTETVYTPYPEKSFEHVFKQVPAVIISDQQEVGTELRISPVDQVSELAKDYCRDKSVLTIYKFLNGFPIHWKYVQQCRKCTGTGKTGNDKCTVCDGSGRLGRSDVTDVVQVTPPKGDDPVLAPDIAGYINPSIEVWDKYNEDQKRMEELIYHTVWGTIEATGKSETATGRFIDTQPVTNELSKYSRNIEFLHNQLVRFVIKFLTPAENAITYHKSYGKRFIIESPDTILEKYTTSKKNGDPSTILDRIMNEYIVSKYKSDPLMLSVQLKKMEVEPYVHWDLVTVSTTFGAEEAGKKIMFQEWWGTADYSMDVKQLKDEFEKYTKENKQRFVKSEPSPVA